MSYAEVTYATDPNTTILPSQIKNVGPQTSSHTHLLYSFMCVIVIYLLTENCKFYENVLEKVLKAYKWFL